MTSSKIIELITKKTEELLSKLNLKADIKAKIIDKENQEMIWINIETEEKPNLLIGQKGSNLSAFQHLVRLMVRRETEEKTNFLIDVNNYRENRERYLKKIATTEALRAHKTKKPVVLDSMTAYERRIVHLTLLHNENVETESTGEADERRVIIKPIDV